ncbi:MAG: hypothetical protein EBZ13_11995, partial [Planctomycetia bacterium]|nr:hypothetical protein [Planctomycetia bacterium]
MTFHLCDIRLGGLLLALLLMGTAVAEPLDFNRDIRPILSENCFYCHGQDGNKREADLRLDQRETAIKAGAIEPGDPTASELVARIHADDPDVLMPPPESNRRLSAEQKAMLSRWIEAGAVYEPHWAFVAPVRPEPPAITDPAFADWPRNAIDRFVLAKLTAAGLRPAAQAER